MNIMYLLFSFTVGGAEKLVTDICNEMALRGNNLFLYIVNKHYDEYMFDKLSQEVKVFCKNRMIGDKNKLSLMLDIHKYCISNSIDVVHCNSFNSPELLMIAKALNPKLKVFYTVHDVGQYSLLNRSRVIYRNILCNSIIAISNSVKADILEQGANSDKVTVIYNAVDLNKFSKVNGKPFNKDNIIIGNVARIDSSKKGQDILIDAIGQLKNQYNIKCYFAGAADTAHEEDLRQLEKMAANVVEGTASEIVFLGNVENIPDFLREIDIFVLPSRYEGFGISLIEAMYMCVPCISSDINGPKEIIGANERGDLFEQGNPSDLAKKLAAIIENFPVKKEKACVAAAYVKENFDIKEMCGQLLNIYGYNKSSK